MQPSLDRIDVSSFSLKRSHILQQVSHEPTTVVSGDATRFAARLLETYKQQLASRQPCAD